RIVELEDERNLAGILRRTGFEETQWRGVGVAAGLDSKLEVIVRVISIRIRREGPWRSMLETLIDQENHHLAGATDPTMVQHPRQVRQDSGVFAVVPGKNLSYAISHTHSTQFRIRTATS